MKNNPTKKDRTINEALASAAQREKDLPQIAQVSPRDWDTVVLADEVKRLDVVIKIVKQKIMELKEVRPIDVPDTIDDILEIFTITCSNQHRERKA